MELDPVKGNISWQHFVKLANAAKVRNAGFTVPFHSAKRAENENTNNSVKNVGLRRENSVWNGNGYMNRVSKKNNNILGQNFDSYA